MTPRMFWITALALLVGAGIADRWLRYSRAHSSSLAKAILCVNALPTQLGSWSGQPTAVNPALIKTSMAHASWIAVYQNERTGQKVHVAVLAGYPGLLTTHLPEDGFSAMGMRLESGSLRRQDLANLTGAAVRGEFACMDFRDPVSADRMRVWQGWYDCDCWSRPDWARFHFTTAPVLFHVQVWSHLVRDPFSIDANAPIDPCRQFLVDELAELTSLLSDPGHP